MEDKITLDREAFRTLASKTRVDILKSLGRRRKMLAELSRQFKLSPSSVKEHMDQLSDAGLVVQIDDGHKWKYYELTSKGREIVSPTGSRIMVILGLSLFAMVFTAWDLARLTIRNGLNSAATRAPDALGSAEDAMFQKAPEAVTEATGAALAPLPFYHVLGLVVFTAVFGISLGYLIYRKTRPVSF